MMTFPNDFSDITRPDEPLKNHTWLKVGGHAQFLVEPRSRDELINVIKACHEQSIPVHVLGGGSNLLVRDDGVSGAVICLPRDVLNNVEIEGTTVRAEAGVKLSHLISTTIRAGLGGLEVLTGIPGTLGGALRGNAGGRQGDIGKFVKTVTVITVTGEQFVRTEDELQFAYRQSSLDELLLLEATLELVEGDPQEITNRMRKIWIEKKASQPFSHQSAGCIFKNPRGQSAGALIDRAGLKGTRVGGASISERHANFIVTENGATAEDVLRLMDLARSKVSDQFNVELESEIEIW
ncbi:UDP-N-acetylmuramate dehydrogenase [Calycomorphotria hydatis]|uniref:UDP-N-acetylenolpyruvoylglucosamine reductase n=1 Tax=Calycomorphotria hydatis TaxID=2528027 RepID=A0A517T6F3_9PLAN|nr:UDP-N-acetylmuramate dehydrogenase [Calycomorphotria hydatis]QDT63956.1 UDP-N-acetylenolpyruvoylglucosamine reductase MurB [Calycomorphotria hydatis]